MEKNRILDTSYTALVVIAACLFLASCSLPQIRVLEDPLTPEEHINLGIAYEQNGEFEPALEQYKEAAKDMPVAYLYMGNVYFQTGQYDEAGRSYRTAITKTGDPRAYNNLAWMYYEQKVHLDEARRLAEEAVRLDPESDVFRDTLDKVRELSVAP